MSLRYFIIISAVAISVQGLNRVNLTKDSVEDTLRRGAEAAVVRLKASVEQSIDSRVDQSLVHLDTFNQACSQPARAGLDSIRNKFKDDIDACLEIVPETLEDLLDLVEESGAAGLKIVGSFWDMVEGFASCLPFGSSTHALPLCVASATTNVIEMAGSDGVIAVKVGLEACGFVFKTVLRFWACVDQDLFQSMVQSTIAEVQQCHDSFISVH